MPKKIWSQFKGLALSSPEISEKKQSRLVWSNPWLVPTKNKIARSNGGVRTRLILTRVNEATSEERPKNIRVLWIFQKKARKILALRKPVE